MNFHATITIAIISISISIALIVITFPLNYWLKNTQNGNYYGMWSGCKNSGTDSCNRWYENGETVFAYKLSPYYKAFQGLQCCMLGLLFVSLVSIFINLKTCPKLFVIYFVDAFLIFLGGSCGVASIVIFGVKVYEPSIHNLEWCFWVSIAAIGVQLIGIVFIIIYSLRIIFLPDNSYASSSLNNSNESGFKKKLPLTNLNHPNKNQNLANQVLPNNYISTPKMSHGRINDVKKNQKQSNENIKSSSQTNSPRFVKSEKKKNKVKKISNHFHYQNEHSLDKAKHKHKNLNKKFSHKHKYKHDHRLPSEFTSEKFQPGYSSEPDVIEYSLDRSWLNSQSFNQSLPDDLDNQSENETVNYTNLNETQEGISNTFHSRHFVKLPKLVYYHGSDYYSRDNRNQFVQ